MVPGLDLLGLAHPKFEAKAVLKAFPQGYALGCFDDPKTFGDAGKRIKLFLDSGKVPALRVHVHWSDAHKIADLKDLQRRLPRYERLALQYSHIPIYVSHSCEYRESSLREVQKRVELVRNLCPSCFVVQSAWQSPTVAGVGLVEKHGPGAKNCGIASYDGGKKGEGLQDVDSEKWVRNNRDAAIVFAWGPRCNLTEETKLPRNKRTASPEPEYIKMLARLMQTKGVPPTPIFQDKVVEVKKPRLYKMAAEDMDGKNSRDNKPLIILKGQTNAVDIICHDGQQIGKFGYYGTYTGGMHRYYSGWKGGMNAWGYQIAAKALQKSGSEWIWIRQGRTYHGPIHPAFRCGYFYADV